MRPARYFANAIAALAVPATILLFAAFTPQDCGPYYEDDMSAPYAGDPNLFPETIPIPDGSDRNYASVFAAYASGLADRTAWLRAQLIKPLLVPLFGGQQAPTGLTSSPLFTPHRIDPAGADTKRGGWLQSTIAADGGGIWWYVPISAAVEVTMVAASINGDDGAGTNPGFPGAADRPFVKLYRQPVDGSDAVLLLTLADETTSQGEYETHHTIPLNPAIPFDPALTFAAGEYLVIHFAGHKGANVGINTLKLYGIEITSALL